MPRFITNEAALACEADVTFLCLPHEQAAAIEPPARGVVVDLSGAHRFADPVVYEEWYGFAHPRPAELGAWCYGLPELGAAHGRPRRQPGLLRDGGAARALAAARATSTPTSVVVDAKSGMTGAGRSLTGERTRRLRARERRRRTSVGEHQHAPEIAQLLGFPVAFVASSAARAARPDRHLLRPLDGRRPARAPARRALRRRATSSRCCPKGRRPSSRACSTRTPRRSASSTTGSPGRTIVICAIDNLGKGAAGQAMQNVNALFGFARDRRAAAVRGPGVSVTAAPRVRRLRRPRGYPARRRPDVALVRSLRSCRGRRRCGRVNRVLAAPVLVSKRHLAVGRAAGGGRQRRRRQRRHRRAEGAPTRRRPQPRPARALGLAPEQVIVLSTGVIGVHAADGPCSCPEFGRRGRARAGRRRRRGRGDPDHGLGAEARGGAARRASRSAGWRRAPG